MQTLMQLKASKGGERGGRGMNKLFLFLQKNTEKDLAGKLSLGGKIIVDGSNCD
jgi:hypothetical protein